LDLPGASELTVDGTTQPGYSGKPRIVIRGGSGTSSYGLLLFDDCAVRGLAVNNFSSVGLLVFGSRNVISGCFIGTDEQGVVAQPNRIGILVEGGEQNLIGGTSAAERNLVSGNLDLGICLLFSSANSLQGNFIGTDVTGTLPLANANDGISIDQSSDSNIGGTAAGEGNLISGNRDAGIRVIGVPASGNIIEGNIIGADRTGTIALGNGSAGVTVCGAGGNSIGGSGVGSRNVISGNRGHGILIQEQNATGNVVEGNFVGVTISGVGALPNGIDGISIVNANENTIGGVSPGSGNVFSANRLYGVAVGGSSNVVQGNFIGTDLSGRVTLPNGSGVAGGGLWVSGFAQTIGGDLAQARNLVCGNYNFGLALDGASNCVVQANWIGIGSDLNSLPNRGDGLVLRGGARNNTVGGSNVPERNICSANERNGIVLEGANTTGNVIVGNIVGLGPEGQFARGNGAAGMVVSSGASANLIGGLDEGEGNSIAYNSADGVVIRDVDTKGITISGNSIYSNGGLAINLQPPGEPNNTATPNDALDSDLGPNALQNSPVITNVTYASEMTVISGLLRSKADSDYAIELFRSDSYSGNIPGQGQFYAGSAEVTTDASGWGEFQLVLPGNYSNQLFAATALDALSGDTSEFSPALTVTKGVLRITEVRVSGQDVQISFTTSTNTAYRVERAVNLPPAAWTTVSGASNVAGTGNVVTITDAGSASVPWRFYRIRQL
jgi:titin